MEVSAIGIGCMGFSTAYRQIPTDEESIRLIRKAHEMGCTFYDTAEIYATYCNEELVGKALKPIRNEIVNGFVVRYAYQGRENTRMGCVGGNGGADKQSECRHAADRSTERVFDDGTPVGEQCHSFVPGIGYRFCRLFPHGRRTHEREIYPADGIQGRRHPSCHFVVCVKRSFAVIRGGCGWEVYVELSPYLAIHG